MITDIVIIYCNRGDTPYLLQSFASAYAQSFDCEGYDKGYADGLEEALTTLGECDAVRAIKTAIDDNFSSNSLLDDIDVGYSIGRGSSFLRLSFI